MKLTTGRSLLFFISIAATIILAEFWITLNVKLAGYENLLAYGITFDILLFIPLAYYFLLVRTRLISPKSLVVLFILLLGLLKLVLPTDNQQHLKYILMVIPAVELVIFLWVLSKLKMIIRTYREEVQTRMFFTDALEVTIRKLVSVNRLFDSDTFVSILVGEIAVLFYSLTGWFTRFKTRVPGIKAFSYHKKKSYTAIVGVLLFIATAELLVMHLIVSRWSSTAAWIITAISIYSLLWIIGDLHAIRLQPIIVSPTDLRLRAGIRWKVVVPKDLIEDFEPMTGEAPETSYLSISVLGKPESLLTLRQPVEVKGMFGIRREARYIGLNIDEAESFREALQ